ncbi:prosaposin-like [Rhea pennata]|uniref:prosaposin-like n=1 Tax=Rhea pennata TaxID=8795 RepID=UPI002E25B6F5
MRPSAPAAKVSASALAAGLERKLSRESPGARNAQSEVLERSRARAHRPAAGPLAGDPVCTERPQDWCRDAATAARCGALEYCRLAAGDLGKGIPCHLCQVAVSVVGKILQDNCTEEKLRGFLDKKCQYLPFQDWSVKCKKMVDTGILVLTQLGKQVLSDPKVVCGTIRLCQPRQRLAGALRSPASPAAPGDDFARPAAPFPGWLRRRPPQEQGDACGRCARLGLPAPGAAARLRRRCASLGPLRAPRCRRFAEARAETAARRAQEEEAEKPAALCEVCQLAVKAAESLLENNVTEEQLVDGIEKVCYMLPHSVISQCKDFVDAYGKAVVIMLLEATDPQAICTLLRCCPKALMAPAGAGALERLAAGAGAFCNVCQIVITYFDNELLKNETLSELGDMLEKGCELLPSPFTGQCEALIVQYEPAAVRLLVQMMDPTFVCTKLRACDSPEEEEEEEEEEEQQEEQQQQEEEELGSDPCARGPDYWCQSVATAAACNAVEHCKRHVWG